MAKIRPVHALVLVALFIAAVLTADFAIDGGFASGLHQRVSPDAHGRVEIDLAALPQGDVRFYRFINSGNQEVSFFVARDRSGAVQVAFDANEACYKLKRGYRHEGEWVVCNKCDKAFEIETVNSGGGGCTPIPLAHRVEDDVLRLAEADLLKGWRYFR